MKPRVMTDWRYLCLLFYVEAAEYWRRVLWYVGAPLTILIGINTYYLEMEHARHLEEHPHIPADYPHLRIRNKV